MKHDPLTIMSGLMILVGILIFTASVIVAIWAENVAILGKGLASFGALFVVAVVLQIVERMSR